MDQGSMYKIRRALSNCQGNSNLNECFFHILLKSFETQTKYVIGGRPWMFPLGTWLHGYKTSSVQHKNSIPNDKLMMTERGQFHHDTLYGS